MRTGAPRQRMPAAERRELITAAALEEFASHGYEGASMGRIGAAAGVTRTVLYDHFPSKRALFAALLKDTHDKLLAHLRERIAADAPMRERCRASFDAFFAFAESEPSACRLLFPEHAPVDPLVAADHRRQRAASNRLLAAMIAPDAERAGIDPASAAGQALFAMQQSALHGALRWWHAHPRVLREDLVTAAMGLMWTGLGGLERGEDWEGEGRAAGAGAPGRR